MFYFDALEKAIHRKIAPDVAGALQLADSITISRPMHSVQVPLQADVQVAYEKGFARFVINGRCFRYGRSEYLHIASVFDTKPISSAQDAAAYIEHVFEEAKRRMLIQLAEDGLSEIFKQPISEPTNETDPL